MPAAVCRVAILYTQRTRQERRRAVVYCSIWTRWLILRTADAVSTTTESAMTPTLAGHATRIAQAVTRTRAAATTTTTRMGATPSGAASGTREEWIAITPSTVMASVHTAGRTPPTVQTRENTVRGLNSTIVMSVRGAAIGNTTMTGDVEDAPFIEKDCATPVDAPLT